MPPAVAANAASASSSTSTAAPTVKKVQAHKTTKPLVSKPKAPPGLTSNFERPSTPAPAQGSSAALSASAKMAAVMKSKSLPPKPKAPSALPSKFERPGARGADITRAGLAPKGGNLAPGDRCQGSGCNGTRAKRWGWPGKPRSHCSHCKVIGMEDTRKRTPQKRVKCQLGDGCTKNPSFGYPGKKPVACVQHKEEGMEQLLKSAVSKLICEADQCTAPARWGPKGEVPRFCLEHRREGEDVSVDDHKRCPNDDCTERGDRVNPNNPTERMRCRHHAPSFWVHSRKFREAAKRAANAADSKAEDEEDLSWCS